MASLRVLLAAPAATVDTSSTSADASGRSIDRLIVADGAKYIKPNGSATVRYRALGKSSFRRIRLAHVHLDGPLWARDYLKGSICKEPVGAALPSQMMQWWRHWTAAAASSRRTSPLPSRIMQGGRRRMAIAAVAAAAAAIRRTSPLPSRMMQEGRRRMAKAAAAAAAAARPTGRVCRRRLLCPSYRHRLRIVGKHTVGRTCG